MSGNIWKEQAISRDAKIAIIGITLAFAFMMIFVGLVTDVMIITPLLFYIPILVAAYWFPKKAVYFAMVVGGINIAVVYLYSYPSALGLTYTTATASFYVLVALTLIIASLSQNLKTREIRYRGIFDHAGAGIFIVRPEKEGCMIIEVNPRGMALLGYTAGDFSGKPLSHLNADLTSSGVLTRIAREGQAENAEISLRKKDGAEIPVIVSGVRMPDGMIVLNVLDNSERKRAEEALLTERRLFVGGPTVVRRWRNEARWPIEYVSPNITKEFGYYPEDLTSGKILFADIIHPDDLGRVEAEIRQHEEKRASGYEQEYRIRTAGGEYRWIYDFTVLERDCSSAVTHYHGYIMDTTERKLAQEQLQRSVKEKEILLREVHHRVKNNMQVISGLIELQGAQIADPEIRRLFFESQNRIRTMALIHEILYRSSDYARIDFSVYLNELLTHLLASYGRGRDEITIETHLAETHLSLDLAVPCGLIANELISNALKHAFPGGRTGRITIDLLRNEEGGYEFSVADNGIGFPENLDLSTAATFGLQLVNGIATHQMRGSIELVRKPGTKVTIRFPEPEMTAR
jgi:PAS domain S-box-containing protein